MKIEIFLGFGIEGSIVYRQLQAPEGLCEFKSDKKNPTESLKKYHEPLRVTILTPASIYKEPHSIYTLDNAKKNSHKLKFNQNMIRSKSQNTP